MAKRLQRDFGDPSVADAALQSDAKALFEVASLWSRRRDLHFWAEYEKARQAKGEGDVGGAPCSALRDSGLVREPAGRHAASPTSGDTA